MRFVGERLVFSRRITNNVLLSINNVKRYKSEKCYRFIVADTFVENSIRKALQLFALNTFVSESLIRISREKCFYFILGSERCSKKL